MVTDSGGFVDNDDIQIGLLLFQCDRRCQPRGSCSND